jgi:hypothetical protein
MMCLVAVVLCSAGRQFYIFVGDIMTIEEMNSLIWGIFDHIFNAVTHGGPNEKPVMQASSTVLSLMKPGLAIHSIDFDNPWTPGNTGGGRILADDGHQIQSDRADCDWRFGLCQGQPARY